MQKPLTPFVSTDPRFAPAPTPQPVEDEADDESPYCECNLEFTFEELDRNKCAHCGKGIIS